MTTVTNNTKLNVRQLIAIYNEELSLLDKSTIATITFDIGRMTVTFVNRSELLTYEIQTRKNGSFSNQDVL